MAFTVEDLNNLIKSVFNTKTFDLPESDYFEFTQIDMTSVYNDMINIYCVLNNIRNGCHIDSINQMGVGYLKEELDLDEKDEELLNINYEKCYLFDNLNLELDKLALTRYPNLKHTSGNYEMSVWDSSKVPNEIVLNSWAFEGDHVPTGNGKTKIRNSDDPYWANTGILLGNEKGYPSYPKLASNKGTAVVRLYFIITGAIKQSDLIIADFDISKPRETELASLQFVVTELEKIKGETLYHPNGYFSKFENVELILTMPRVGGNRRKTRKIKSKSCYRGRPSLSNSRAVA